MQRSFSIVEDDQDEPVVSSEIKSLNDQSRGRFTYAEKPKDLDVSDSDDDFILKNHITELKHSTENLPRPATRQLSSRVLSAGPSGRKTVIKSSTNRHLSSESDLDYSDEDGKSSPIPGEYDPKQYEHLDANEDIKEIFQYIGRYTPQHLNLDTKFKSFIPEFIPAVGDIDAFLKVIPPDALPSGDPFDGFDQQLGLLVLDEPASNQSDPALLHLQLRATSVNATHENDNLVVKKVDNIEKNSKIIDKWIKDIYDLHKSRSSPTVRYPEPMPDLDDLMQEWQEDIEIKLKQNGFPQPTLEMTLTEYVDVVCGVFGIPVNTNRMQSLHLLFCLYAAVKNSQLFQAANSEKFDSNNEEATMDQLVLD